LNTVKWFVILFVAAMLVVVAGSGIALWRYANEPGSRRDHQVIFAIAPGEAFDALVSRLHSDGLISGPLKFKVWVRLKGDDKKLKAGEYYLSASMTPNQILEVLVGGKSYLYRLTVPEGFNLKQIAAVIADQGLGDAQTFLDLATDPKTAAHYKIKARTLEGYLFPDTYLFPKGVSSATIIDRMIERFNEQFRPEWRDRARELHMTVHEIVTLASIIEKETGDPAERPLISSVFHNRLKRKMRLESDPTVIYGIKDFNGNITRKDLKTRTPYNTYVIKGLPPGPIASPGSAAIKAALYPADTHFLFFVSKKDKTHHFSTTIREHNRAVRKYQLSHHGRP
jgi:peptidoglycan lytic transglycosylase G